MGQNSSRSAHQAVSSTTTTTNQAPASGHGHSSFPSTSSSTSQVNPSRRSTVRRGLLRLMKPSSTPPSSPNAVPNTITPLSTTASRSKRWGTSRRWSKTPDIETLSPEPRSAALEEGVDVKGKGRASDDIVGEEPPLTQGDELGSTGSESSLSDHAHSFSPASSSSSTTTSPSILATPPTHMHQTVELPEELIDAADTRFTEDYAKTPDIRNEHEEVIISPETTFADVTQHTTDFIEPSNLITTNNQIEDVQTGRDPDFSPSLHPSEEFPPSSAPPAPPTPTTARQFPPPGTLVVVQGVVHTTDVPPPHQSPPSSRTTSTSHRSPSASNVGADTEAPVPASGVTRANSLGNGTRSRLSAFLPRARPASVVPANVPRNNEDLASGEADNEGGGNSGNGVAEDGGNRESPPASGSISSSSIDVLGTLLSVAAAATAASLLTGSSEPIFQSGLAPTNASTSAGNDESGPPPTPSLSQRPMSPTPTAGLGTLGLGISEGQSREAGGRDRMRNVWGSLRERLGLRASGPTSSPLDTHPGSGLGGNSESLGTSGSGAGSEPRQMDAREAMLAEMARAFNMGLGLPNNGTGASSLPTVPSPSPPPSSSSPSPSQETTSEEDGAAPATSAPRLPPADSFERFLIDLQTDLRATLSQPDEPSSGTPTGSADPNDSESDRHSLSTAESSPSSEGHYIDAEDGASASGSSASSPHRVFPSAETAEPGEGASGSRSTSSTAGNHHRRSGGGINWWRLYRFPPISAPQGQATAPTSIEPSQDGSTVEGVSTSAEPSNATEDSTAGDGAVPPTNSVPTASSIVIPVIVVGLQSVNRAGRRPETRQDRSASPSQGEDALDHEEGTGGGEEDVDLANFPAPADGEEVGSGNGSQRRGSRRWRSRAADAFRNLRPGRRQEREAQPAVVGPGSRTFLIYVIGGYYPPDHHIVTGADSLDSFEALWELAELLGQAKPPTASKEELEKSGLEIIKPCSLAMYEKEGRVASNCVERCLICLDDYEPEDELRIMKCKHAFHKCCVDKWMTTGRNNCPACRSKGVSSPETATET